MVIALSKIALQFYLFFDISVVALMDVWILIISYNIERMLLRVNGHSLFTFNLQLALS